MPSIPEGFLKQYRDDFEKHKTFIKDNSNKLTPRARQRIDDVFKKYEAGVQKEEEKAKSQGSDYMLDTNLMKKNHAITKFMINLQSRLDEKKPQLFRSQSVDLSKQRSQSEPNSSKQPSQSEPNNQPESKPQKENLWSKIKNFVLDLFDASSRSQSEPNSSKQNSQSEPNSSKQNSQSKQHNQSEQLIKTKIKELVKQNSKMQNIRNSFYSKIETAIEQSKTVKNKHEELKNRGNSR